MEQHTDTIGMMDLMSRPAFSVKDGIITKLTTGAAHYLLEPGSRIEPLLETGAEEYAAFTGGCLYLGLNISGHILGASVTRLADFDLFCIEQDADNSELQAMALAARELREPLANVMATAERLFPVSALENDPDAREQVSRINRGLFQMLRVIGNMSDAGRYSTDPALRQEVRDICAVIDEAFEKAASLLEQAGILVHYEPYATPVYTLTDSEKLERAIFNILSNAVKFTPRGGSIEVKLTRRGNKMYLSVQDSGCGIEDSIRGSVFSRYTRRPGLEDSRFGIGLGMVLIRAAATVHGGTVLIDHPASCGTRIIMSLAIRQDTRGQLRSPLLTMDYAGERDHSLIELSNFLPASFYDPLKIN